MLESLLAYRLAGQFRHSDHHQISGGMSTERFDAGQYGQTGIGLSESFGTGGTAAVNAY
jgi:hypothetical protein